MQGSYLGPEFSDDNVKEYLNEVGANFEIFDENGFKILEETYLNEENCPPNFTLKNSMEFTLKLK